jgi:hypothetical protein
MPRNVALVNTFGGDRSTSPLAIFSRRQTPHRDSTAWANVTEAFMGADRSPVACRKISEKCDSIAASKPTFSRGETISVVAASNGVGNYHPGPGVSTIVKMTATSTA